MPRQNRFINFEGIDRKTQNTIDLQIRFRILILNIGYVDGDNRLKVPTIPPTQRSLLLG